MMEEITWSQLLEWQAYYAIEPWGEERADLRAGIVASTMGNLWSKRRVSPRDFMPDFGRRTRRQAPEQIASVLSMAARAAKAAKERKK